MMPIMRFGQAQHAIDRANGAPDTGADRTSDHAADGTRGSRAFVGPFLRAPDDALGVAGLWQTRQGKKGGSTSKKQANGQARRQLRGQQGLFIWPRGERAKPLVR